MPTETEAIIILVVGFGMALGVRDLVRRWRQASS